MELVRGSKTYFELGLHTICTKAMIRMDQVRRVIAHKLTVLRSVWGFPDIQILGARATRAIAARQGLFSGLLPAKYGSKTPLTNGRLLYKLSDLLPA